MRFMETMQDKLIREKLNSLDTLPERYVPSLDSKWELLLAGQPEKKKRIPEFWYAIAASLVLLLTFGYLLLPKPAKQNTNTIAHQTIQTKQPVHAIKELIQPEAKIAVAKPVIVTKHLQKATKNARVKPEKTQSENVSEEIITAGKNPAPAIEQTILMAGSQSELLAKEA